MLWKTPVYKFRVPKGSDAESAKLQEVVFDVTGSAPPFLEPSDNFKRIVDEVFADKTLGAINSVLEFGAAKLKNIPYLLSKGKTVCAVEFEELTTTSQAKDNIRKAKKYSGKFQKLLFPHPFIANTSNFDIALLINVVPVMPVPSERLLLMQFLHDKAKYVLWIAQKEGSYKAIREKGKQNFGDGLWMGTNRKFKTFYRHHTLEEVDELMALYGFDRLKKYSGSDDAALYVRNDYVLFKNVLTATKIRDQIPDEKGIKDPETANFVTVEKAGEIKPIVPSPQALAFETLYIEKIKSILPGPTTAEEYHRVASWALARIFRGSLKNMEIKVEASGGLKIIDTVFTNDAERGFFKKLPASVNATHVMVEAKNYADDIGNPEVDQLHGRFNPSRGNFGLLLCRSIKDKKAVLNRCKSHLPSKSHIIILTDEDLLELLEYSRDGDTDSIDELMHKKFKELVF